MCNVNSPIRDIYYRNNAIKLLEAYAIDTKTDIDKQLAIQMMLAINAGFINAIPTCKLLLSSAL